MFTISREDIKTFNKMIDLFKYGKQNCINL